ncbi:hypothetical protein MMSR116_29265 [Methylobacterium mesophilicum SR1.6/6]|uniref:Uncharacterized protein n=1 Tax=Methylobacterium mesophilicum SR1.6/6 TaxID=908290 RepID=A0A6B9FYD7_9HYPH|nr:hypothetical protein [Methylobacterium mesophilicum]QGY05528.1 hypothetical protein MMSR116_29265 [Methylobacterium mesophilicum SR1.6/6]
MIAVAYLLRGLAALLQALAVPFLAIGWVATPILSTSGYLQEVARQWDRRLWSRGGRTDLNPPPEDS